MRRPTADEYKTWRAGLSPEQNAFGERQGSGQAAPETPPPPRPPAEKAAALDALARLPKGPIDGTVMSGFPIVRMKIDVQEFSDGYEMTQLPLSELTSVQPWVRASDVARFIRSEDKAPTPYTLRTADSFVIYRGLEGVIARRLLNEDSVIALIREQRATGCGQ